MKGLFLLAMAALLLPASAVRAQQPDYLPLEPGNTWSYYETIEPPNAPPDTIWTGSFTVAQPLSINDTLYYYLPLRFALADTLRNDGEGRIFARLDGKDRLLFDFTLPDSAIYAFREPDDGERYHGHDYTVLVRHNRVVDRHAGRFEDAIEFVFDDEDVIDEETAFTFAPNVGLVRAWGDGGQIMFLHSAVVGGVTITDVEAAPGLPEADWS